jgi:hypothetical protein
MCPWNVQTVRVQFTRHTHTHEHNAHTRARAPPTVCAKFPCASARKDAHTSTHTHTHMYARTRTRTHARTHIYTHARTYTHTHAQARIHMHVHTRTHAYARRIPRTAAWSLLGGHGSRKLSVGKGQGVHHRRKPRLVLPPPPLQHTRTHAPTSEHQVVRLPGGARALRCSTPCASTMREYPLEGALGGSQV